MVRVSDRLSVLVVAVVLRLSDVSVTVSCVLTVVRAAVQVTHVRVSVSVVWLSSRLVAVVRRVSVVVVDASYWPSVRTTRPARQQPAQRRSVPVVVTGTEAVRACVVVRKMLRRSVTVAVVAVLAVAVLTRVLTTVCSVLRRSVCV